jgi:aminoglycoside 2'-N-acetyltransferase I
MFSVSQLSASQITSALKIELKELLERSFEGDFSQEDWLHTFGGARFVGHLGDQVVAHGAVVPRKMHIDGESVDVGYVEAIAVVPNHWRNGYGSLLLADITSFCKSNFSLSMLSTDEKDFYSKSGWRVFQGMSYVLQDGKEFRTEDEDDGLMFILGDEPGLKEPRKVVCNSRSGDDW